MTLDDMRQISSGEPYQLPPPPGYTQFVPQEEKEVNLRDYWRVIRKRQWMILAFFLIVVVTAAVATFTTRPTYRGTATIQINKENPQILDFKEILAVNPFDMDYYQTQYKILESRTLARRVIQNLKLTEHPEFLPEPETPFQKWKSEIKGSVSEFFSSFIKSYMKGSGKNSARDLPENAKGSPHGRDTGIVNQFLSKLKIEPVRNSRIAKIHFDSQHPELSNWVPNALADAYIQQNLETRFNATQQAKDWLGKQLEDMKAKVERADEALENFGSRHGIISLDEKENIVMQRLTELNDALAKTESERMAKEAIYKQIKDRNFDSLPSVLENKLIQELKQSSIQLEGQYTKLSETFKPEYPEMVRLRKQMEAVQRRLEIEGGKFITGIKNEYELALRKESLVRQAFEAQKARVMEMKQRAIQYNILKRESDTNKELYRGLLQRMKETGVSAGLTASNIQIVDEAELPRGPYKPNTRLNLLMAAVVGLFLGVGLAFFFEYLDNTIKTPEDVKIDSFSEVYDSSFFLPSFPP